MTNPVTSVGMAVDLVTGSCVVLSFRECKSSGIVLWTLLSFVYVLCLGLGVCLDLDKPVYFGFSLSILTFRLVCLVSCFL